MRKNSIREFYVIPKVRQIDPNNTNPSRAHFWAYCQRAEGGCRERARKANVPFSIDRYFIDNLFIDQKYCCAISGIDFDVPGATKRLNRSPFGPSIDRVVPRLGYVPGNVRIVCNLVNLAMSNWGRDNLFKMAWAIANSWEFLNWQQQQDKE